VKIPLFIAEINDDCLLGVDFLKIVNLENVFDSVFGKIKLENKENLKCCRIEEISERNSLERVPTILKKLFVDNSANLDKIRKNTFADLLCEFQDVFSEDIVAGNCSTVEHVINVKDSSPIKQVSRRIPIYLREKVFKSIEEMKDRGVIEKSQSP